MVTVTRPDVSQAIESVRLICVDTARNSNKQWIGWVMPNGDLYAEYGRVGYAQKPHVYSCRSVSAAQNELSRLILEKRSKGYQQVAVEEAPIEPLDFSALDAGEVQSIWGRLERLQQRAETIGQYAGITFDGNRGVFSTQMGMISVGTIAHARQALRRVKACLPNRNQQFVAAVESYLAIIPLKVGMTLAPDRILGTRAQVQRQALLLDDLALALSEVREIRDLIREALGVVAIGGSDERARWLQWGAVQEQVTTCGYLEEHLGEAPTGDTGDERACWSRWTSGASGL
jgi:predicted DNA-binding WGR domain protein